MKGDPQDLLKSDKSLLLFFYLHVDAFVGLTWKAIGEKPFEAIEAYHLKASRWHVHGIPKQSCISLGKILWRQSR